jgi:hypothetical protein
MVCLLFLALVLDLPLTMVETSGVKRTQEPVTFGVPLPRGLVTDIQTLRLTNVAGEPLHSTIRPVNRWPGEDSIQWVHVDFFADAPAGAVVNYRLQSSAAPNPPPPANLRVRETERGITVDTGATEFTVFRSGHLLNGPGLVGVDVLLRSDERIYKLSNWRQTELTIEEQTPTRVVLKRTGSHGWVNGEDKALDYILRVIAWANRPQVKLVYSFINRQGRAMSDFVRLDGLWLQGTLTRDLGTPQRVEQLSSEPRRHGWFTAGGIGFGVRWFWQLFPKGFQVAPNGTLRLELFPETARPQNIYTGVAKTHEILVSFDGQDRFAELEDPLFAAAPPKWYCRDTKALGRLTDSAPDAYRPEYWSLVQRYDNWLVASRDAVRAKRDRMFAFQGREFNEYGMLNFGDAMHKLITDDSKPDYGIHWETEYYDFPHALFLHFFRTGDRASLRMAIEAAAHLADVDISHHEVEPGRDGAPRTGPGLNHWTRYSNGVFISSTSWAFYKNEGLFDRWLLTGDLWSRDVARLSADFGITYDGLDLQSNTRSIGHGLFAMMKAYEVLGDRKYLDRAHWIIDTVHAWQDADVDKLKQLSRRIVWHERFRGGYSDQSWMYGIALEAMAQAGWTYQRPEIPRYMKRAADWVFANPKEWDAERRQFLNSAALAVMLTPGLAYISETSGDPQYFDIAMENFRRQVDNDPPTNRLKLFAQLFRNSQRFLWYLSREASPKL